jgi:hypothetical protein
MTRKGIYLQRQLATQLRVRARGKGSPAHQARLVDAGGLVYANQGDRSARAGHWPNRQAQTRVVAGAHIPRLFANKNEGE